MYYLKEEKYMKKYIQKKMKTCLLFGKRIESGVVWVKLFLGELPFL